LKLRIKTLIITAITLIFLISAIFTVEAGIMFQIFMLDEMQDIKTNINHMENWLSEQESGLVRSLEAWSVWGDTSTLVVDPRADYVDAKFNDFTFLASRVNAIAIYDSRGRYVLGKAVDFTLNQSVPVPSTFQYLQTSSPLTRFTNPSDRVAGMMIVDGKPMLVASMPITTSDDPNSVPIGSVLMGRYLDTARLSEVLVGSNMKLSVYAYDRRSLPAEAERTASSSGDVAIYVVREDEGTKSYGIIKDIEGLPAITLRMEMPRDRLEIFRKNQGYFLFGTTTIGLAIMTLNFFLLDMFVVSRIRKLRNAADELGQAAEKGATRAEIIQVESNYDDEITYLAKDVNALLSKLTAANRRLVEDEQQYHYKLESEVERKTHMLMEMNEQLRKMEESKNQFLFNMGHDLKTPLAVIDMNIGMLKKGKPKQTEASEALIRRNITRLKQQIEEIIQLTKFEQGGSIQAEDLDICEVVQDEVRIHQDFARAKGMDIRVEGCGKPIAVKGDRRLLAYGLGNYLSNAVKYSADTSVLVRVAQEGANVKIEVIDAGAGVPVEQRENLFTKFFRGDKTGPGTGVGLYMAYEIAKKHGGEAHYRPNKPKGSIFYFVLPKKARGE